VEGRGAIFKIVCVSCARRSSATSQTGVGLAAVEVDAVEIEHIDDDVTLGIFLVYSRLTGTSHGEPVMEKNQRAGSMIPDDCLLCDADLACEFERTKK
jgi:hypothetical protein